MTDKRMGFWSGVLLITALRSLYQDWHGLEDYIESIQQYWVSALFTVPLALVIFAISIALLVVTPNQKEKKT